MTDIPEQSGSPALGDRLVAAALGAYEAAAVDLGHRLGWYRALAGTPTTPGELAAGTGTHPRYAREWLEQQAVAGYLTVDDVALPPEERCYTLPDEHRAVLVDDDDPAYAVPLATLAMTFTRNVPRLAEVYRSGGGLSWAEMGPDARVGQAAANRPFFVGPLVSEVLPSLPEIDALLRAGGRVADVGCGLGWSSIGMAAGYPAARVDGFDVDGPSLEQARRNAVAAGVADRVRFSLGDVGGMSATGEYDLVTAFECIHDLPDPVAVLSAMRAMARPGGVVLVVDENVAERFTVPGSEVDRLMYGYSLTCCLPDAMSAQPSAATGTVLRPAVLDGYARAAGFARVDVLPVAHDFFRFYRLVTG